MNKVLHTKYGTARISTKGYYMIESRKEGNYHKYLHRLIFEDFYGFKVPKNYVIHHKDGNPCNNCILNLQLLNKKEHLSLHNKGKTLSDEHKNKISIANKGKIVSEETKKKLSEANKGKTLSEGTKHKMSENNARYWQDKERSEETKRKISKSLKGKYASIQKIGKKAGKQNYCIYKDGKRIKRSINPSKLLDWFTKEYPKEILQIKIKL